MRLPNHLITFMSKPLPSLTAIFLDPNKAHPDFKPGTALSASAFNMTYYEQCVCVFVINNLSRLSVQFVRP